MLFAAAAPATISYLLRQPSQTTLDCRDLYTINSPPIAGSLPQSVPQYVLQNQCRNMTTCEGAGGRVSERVASGVNFQQNQPKCAE